jgi:succinate-semialdehyde dehydrogenase / glutarate-semialdehyde dehydrogenase
MDMFIDGAWRQAESGARHDVINPTTGAVVDTVPIGSKADADIAILAAARAFQTWRRTPVATRARLQKKAANLMRQRAPALGRTLTSELGRPTRCSNH